MKRTLFTLLAAAAVGVMAFSGAYHLCRHVPATFAWSGSDDLAWLRAEFQLSSSDITRIRALHEGYLPKCAEMCRKITAKKREVESVFSSEVSATSRRELLGKALSELALLRAECQLQMLEHFIEVSQAMPPEQGRQYLAEMQRLTLGYHEQIEQSMSKPAESDHEHR
jgi:hypothetical protein